MDEWTVLTCLISGLKGVLSFPIGYYHTCSVALGNSLLYHFLLKSSCCSNTTKTLLQSLVKMVWFLSSKSSGLQSAQAAQWTCQGRVSFKDNCHFLSHNCNNCKNMTTGFNSTFFPVCQCPSFASTQLLYENSEAQVHVLHVFSPPQKIMFFSYSCYFNTQSMHVISIQSQT